MSVHGGLIAALYDRWFEPAERAGLASLRRQLLSPAAGAVLEIGAGTGLNLGHYPDAVERLMLAEPDRAMLRRLTPKLLDVRACAGVKVATAEQLPCETGSIDFVISTFVLCMTPSPARALKEVRRVLRGDGRLLFLEHVRSDEDRLSRLQDLLAPAWRRISYGCHCNRPTLDTIRAGGFEVVSLQTGRLPKAPPLWRPYVLGEAVLSLSGVAALTDGGGVLMCAAGAAPTGPAASC